MQIKNSFDATELLSSKVLLQQIDNYINLLKATTSNGELIEYIKEKFIELSDYYVFIGNKEFKTINTSEEVHLNEIYLLHHSLSESFKDLALAHRDVILQLQISKYKFVEQTVSEEKKQNHFQLSKELLLNATTQFKTLIINESSIIYESEKEKKKLLTDIDHRKNPWDIYRSQFETIKVQINDIAGTTLIISKMLKVFSDIKSHNTFFLTEANTNTENLKRHLGEAIKSIKLLTTTDNIPDLISWIDTTLKSVSKDVDLQIAYADTIELKIKILSERNIPVSTDNGLLLTKKIDFNKTVKKWFDVEILPSVIDLWDSQNNMKSYFKHSFLNLKSSLLLEKNNNSLDAIPSQLKTLQNVHYSLSENETKIREIASEIEEKFSRQFQLTKIYTNDEFLEVSLQSSIANFATGKTNIVSNIKKKLRNHFSRFNSKYDRSTLFNTQNKVEESIQCINHRMFKEGNALYDTLFLNKNLIGDLFLIPRKEQEETFSRSVEQWKNGFNKAILITGDTLSGKSTFIQYIGQKYFKKNTIYLEPDTKITYGGRKFTTTNDLKEALQNVKKGFSNRKPLLVIDNLELWRDDTSIFLNNIRALLSFISTESDNVLVAVISSKEMQFHLDNRIRFSEGFSSTINLNKATFEEIHKAVLLRHGASHKTLINKDQELLSPKNISQHVLKLSKKLDSNIGEVLQAFTYSTTIVENNKVIYEYVDNGFKDFFNIEEIIILKYVLLYKNITEIDLKYFVGSTYKTTFKSSLKRLTNTKVLLRESQGKLVLNTVIAMDIKQILIYRGILN